MLLSCISGISHFLQQKYPALDDNVYTNCNFLQFLSLLCVVLGLVQETRRSEWEIGAKFTIVIGLALLCLAALLFSVGLNDAR